MEKSFIAMTASLLLVGLWIRAEVLADFEYDAAIGSYWSLSEKASSLDVKADYLDKFVSAVDAAHLTGHNAIFLKTPDNSVEQNLVALHSLQTRMHEIRKMDPTSFPYQQAITQITAQEQGEAGKMLDAFYGIWYLQNHFLLWGWIDFIAWTVMAMAVIISGIWLCIDWNENH